MRFENLTDVHTRRNAERVENDFHGRAVRHVRHVFLGNDTRDDTLVAVAACHFVADGQLALHRDIGFYEFDDAWRQLIALLELGDALVRDFAEDVNLARGHLFDFVNLLDEKRVFVVETQPLQVAGRDFFEDVAIEFRALREQALVGALVVKVSHQLLSTEQVVQSLQALVGENADFVAEVLFELGDLTGFDGLVAFVFFRTLAAEDFHVNDGALNARRAVERGVANVAGFFAEDGAKKFFFRRERGFTLRSHLADEDVAGLHGGADADYAAFV